MILKARIEKFWDAVLEKNVAEIEAAYISTEETYVILEGPRYSTLGFSKIAKGWVDFCDSPIKMQAYEWVEGPFEEIEGKMGWLGGITDLTLNVKEKAFTTRFRVSFVMVLSEGDWKIKHEHVSAPLPDPYGIGDWLKT